MQQSDQHSTIIPTHIKSFSTSLCQILAFKNIIKFKKPTRAQKLYLSCGVLRSYLSPYAHHHHQQQQQPRLEDSTDELRCRKRQSVATKTSSGFAVYSPSRRADEMLKIFFLLHNIIDSCYTLPLFLLLNPTTDRQL